MNGVSTDILILGGGVGGVAAALAAARNGARVIIVEPTDWIGGQLTSQGVPPDENQWVETFGASRSYQALRASVRDWYRRHRPLTPAALRDPRLNPGGGWVSRLCAEPRVWHEAIGQMLAEHAASGRVSPLLGHAPVSAETFGDRVRAVTLADRSGAQITVLARLYLDATETGDLLGLAGIEHAIGAEHRDTHGEMHGRTDCPPAGDWLDQQACSWCFALEHRPGEDHTIDRPARYDFWRGHVPTMSDGSEWTGPLFSWTVPSHNAKGRRTFRLVPPPDAPDEGELEMWGYRRIVDASLHATPVEGLSDVTLINMVQMDYWLRPLLGVTEAQRTGALAEARELSRCLLHWMQTEAPRHDGHGAGYPGLRLRGDVMGTLDGFAKHPYIREPRRLLARTIVSERHVGTDQRRAEGLARRATGWDATPFGSAERFADSVAIGHYHIDLHPSCAGRNSVYVPCAPFRIPMGALIPRRVRNVLAAGKCLGVSHVVNAATRMHTTEWHVGEAAGTLAAHCLLRGLEPHEAHESGEHVRDVQAILARDGAPIAWPWEC